MTTTFEFLKNVFNWLKCYTELLQLTIEEGLFFNRPTMRNFPPSRIRNFNALSDAECFHITRLSKENLVRLFRAWRIPQRMRIRTNSSNRLVNGERAMMIFLCHTISGRTYVELSDHYFGGDPRLNTYIIRAMIDHLYNNFFDTIAGNSLQQFSTVSRVDLLKILHS